MELITLETVYTNEVDASLIKHKLENNDIPCVLIDTNMVGLYSIYNPAIGGIKIKVRKEDYEKALKIIEEVSE
ncbi:putative signal transducing protein [Balneicella halophila]|uniref:Putative signal transducing protein n=1 Tax=Balneicella halophila TaxID=1537566 RepID=A0A7L4UQJ7_BALHA|nr:DUF2007 domain-containing protein [Balneicella halophila]PVX52023.1 putative signal transducing protein [Balneicella halophila]